MQQKLISLAALVLVLMLLNSLKSTADVEHPQRALSQALLQQLPHRALRLKPGMTRDQVWKTLALPVYYQHLGGYGSGPPQGFAEVHGIGHYTLCLIFDEPRLKSYTLTSDPHMWNGCWYKSAKELHHKELHHKELHHAEQGLVKID